MFDLHKLKLMPLLFLLPGWGLYAEPSLPDPLRPQAWTPSPAMVTNTDNLISLPRLTMIMRHGDQRFAVIDGRVRREGEQWDQYVLRAVRLDSVILACEGGETLELGLLPRTVIKSEPRP